MSSDFSVVVDYKNKNMDTISTHEYTMNEYVQMLSIELKRIIADVENSFYDLQNGKDKNDWDDNTIAAFNKIRHKLLDQANAIERFPINLRYKGVPCGSIKASEYLTAIINYITKNK